MKQCVILSEKIPDFWRSVLETLSVFGPVERSGQPGSFKFDWVGDAEELVLEYPTTTLPPKKAFFPPVDTVLSFSMGDPPEIASIKEDRPFVLAGVHPCDLAALESLDLAYDDPPADGRWRVSRRRATIVGVDCLPDEYCFCTSMNTETARVPCDLFLTGIKRGFLVEIHTAAGEKLLVGVSVEKANPADIAGAEKHRQEKKKRISAKIDAEVSELARILQEGGLEQAWKAVAQRCYGCGSCNTTCPTCFCFDIRDEFNVSGTEGVRRRVWDSCQLAEFALVAGEHNFRDERWQRVRHRWRRKFLYLYKQFQRPFCTGCGRCSRACTADINIVDETNNIVAAAKGVRHA